MADVELSKIRKNFGETTVLHELSLSIRSGKFVALDEPSGGDIRIGGRSVNGVGAKDRGVAMVFQNYALYPHMSVRENMAFALKLARVPAPEIAARTLEAARP